MNKSNKSIVAIVLSLLLFQSFAFAAVPQVVADYIQVFVDLAQGQMGIIFIILILAFSGYLAWKNGNLAPLFWGLAASVLIGGASPIAQRFIEFGNSTF